MEVLDRFDGNGNTLSWLVRAERYFTYLGFPEKDWLPLPSFYLDGDALTWFNWLFRNKQFHDWKHFKEKLFLHFRNHNFSALMGQLDIPSHACSTDLGYATVVPPEAQVSSFLDCHIRNSYGCHSALEDEASNADHLFVERLVVVSPESHDPNTCLLEGKLSATSTDEVFEERLGDKENLVKPNYAVKDYCTEIENHIFDEMSHQSNNSEVFIIEGSNAKVLTNTSGSDLIVATSEEDEVLNESPHSISFGEIRPSATRVSLLVPFAGREYAVSNKHLERDLPARFVDANSLDTGGTPKWLTDLVTFEDVFLASFSWNLQLLLIDILHKKILIPECATPTSAMHLVEVLFEAENGKSIGRFTDQHILSRFPFDPGAYLFIVTPIGRLQVLRLQPRTSKHTLLPVKLYTFQAFGALSYVCRAINIGRKDIKHHNFLVTFQVSLVNLCDWGHAKALIEREPNISCICSQYYKATVLIFGATKYTTAMAIWSTGSVLMEKNAKEEIVKPWPLMDLVSLDALSKLSEDQIFLDWMSCCCGGTEKNMPSCDQNLLFPDFFISPCRNIKFQHARITDCYLLAQQPAMNIFVWDPGILSKFMALTSYAVNIAALLLVGSTGKFYLIPYANSMTQVWDLGRKWGIHSYLLLTDFALAVARCGADDFIIFILRSVLDPGDRIIEFPLDSSLSEFVALHTCSLTMMVNVLLLDDVEADLMKRASIAVADSVLMPMIIEGKSTSILVGPNSRVEKVTTTGRLMCYLAYFAGCISIAEHSRDLQLLESNPVLELISNTKTVQTDNSSCCGILLETQFDKSRRVSVPTEMNKRCRLGDPEFDYLNQSYCYELVSVTGPHGSLGIKKVMEIVALKVKEQEPIFRFVASLLPLGNLELAKGTEFESSIHKVDRHGSAFDTYSSLDRFTNIMLP